jgi:hypothetical protein
MANACERSIADREYSSSADDLVLSQVVPQAHSVAERTPLDRVIEGRWRELANSRLTSFCNVLGRQAGNRGSSGMGALLESFADTAHRI